jgi:hypothetical protein
MSKNSRAKHSASQTMNSAGRAKHSASQTKSSVGIAKHLAGQTMHSVGQTKKKSPRAKHICRYAINISRHTMNPFSHANTAALQTMNSEPPAKWYCSKNTPLLFSN